MDEVVKSGFLEYLIKMDYVNFSLSCSIPWIITSIKNLGSHSFILLGLHLFDFKSLRWFSGILMTIWSSML